MREWVKKHILLCSIKRAVSDVRHIEKTALYYVKTRDVKGYFFSFNAVCKRSIS